MTVIHAVQAGQGGPVRIACINLAKTPLGVDFDTLTTALQKCYDQHFLPVWGYPVTLYNTNNPQPTDWLFAYLDNADEAGALGYHDLSKDGRPLSKIFVETTIQAGDKVSVTACHELFEMVIDPIANLWAEARDGTEYAYEMCDPVEADTFLVDGIEMSNFVHPAWFEPFRHLAGTKYDHLGLLKKPFSMTEGGYMIIKRNGHVSQVFGSAKKRRAFARENRLEHRSEFRKAHGLRYIDDQASERAAAE